MNTTSNIRRNARRGAAALLIGGAAAATLSMPANAASDATWEKLAQCESGGNWSINTGNGFSGGLQFTPSTWAAFGGQGAPQNASKAEQIRVAENVLAGQGWGAWPACSAQLGLTEGPTLRDAAPQAQEVTQVQEQAQAAPVEAAPAAPAPVAEPAPAPQATAEVQTEYVAPAAASGQYTVKAGDTLSSIAASYGTTWQQLHAANANTVADANLIYPGQVLEIPAA